MAEHTAPARIWARYNQFEPDWTSDKDLASSDHIEYIRADSHTAMQVECDRRDDALQDMSLKAMGLSMERDALQTECDEQAERIEELEAACEVVSNEFEGDLWKVCRRLLEKTGYDVSGSNPDGIQADSFEDHMIEALKGTDTWLTQKR